MSTGLDAEQIEMWEYWGPSEVKKEKTPLQMVREYHEAAGIDLDVDITKDAVDLINLRYRLTLWIIDLVVDTPTTSRDTLISIATILTTIDNTTLRHTSSR